MYKERDIDYLKAEFIIITFFVLGVLLRILLERGI